MCQLSTFPCLIFSMKIDILLVEETQKIGNITSRYEN